MFPIVSDFGCGGWKPHFVFTEICEIGGDAMERDHANPFNHFMHNVRWLTCQQLFQLMLEIVRELQFRDDMGRLNMINLPPVNHDDDDIESYSADLSD